MADPTIALLDHLRKIGADLSLPRCWGDRGKQAGLLSARRIANRERRILATPRLESPDA